MRTDENEAVQVLEAPERGKTDRDRVRTSLKAFQKMVQLTAKGKKGLYHASIDPDAQYAMGGQDWDKTVSILEKQLGLEGQPRLVVKHTKKGREHIHVIWQRVKQRESGKFSLVSDSGNYKKHELAARRMEKELGHSLLRGAFTNRARDGQTKKYTDPRPEAVMNHAEHQQGERTQKDIKAIKAEVTRLWRESQTGTGFVQELDKAGYTLANGDRKAMYMVVDRDGEAYGLRRSVRGIKNADITARLEQSHPLERLQSVTQVRETLRTREKEEQQPAIRPEPERTASNDNINRFREQAEDITKGATPQEPDVIDLQKAKERLAAKAREARIVDKVAELEQQRNDQNLRHLDEWQELEVRHSTQNRLMGDKMEAAYGQAIRAHEAAIHAASTRMERGGVFYRLFGRERTDRAAIESHSMGLADARRREAENWQPLRTQQREERERKEQAHSAARHSMDMWIEQQLTDFKRSLEPHRSRSAERTPETGRDTAPDITPRRSVGGDFGRAITRAPEPEI